MNEPRMIIAVMGPTGSGKSTFIRSVTDRKDIKVGHGLESSQPATNLVQSYELELDGAQITLVDTPGFDDSRGREQDIVQSILDWLWRLTGQKQMLNSILYFHRIIDPRLTGTARSNMRMFSALCGKENLGKVVLATTFWDQLGERTAMGEAREVALKDDRNFWKPMMEKGSSAVRLSNDRQQNIDLLTQLAHGGIQFYSQTQKELLAGTPLAETEAARQAHLDLERFAQEQERRLEEQKRELQQSQKTRIRAQNEQVQRMKKVLEQEQQEAMEKVKREDAKRKAKRERAEQLEQEQARIHAQKERLLREKLLKQEQTKRKQDQQWRKWLSHTCSQRSSKRAICAWCSWRLDRRGTHCYREYPTVPVKNLDVCGDLC